MENQHNLFATLVQRGTSCLGRSQDEIKSMYSDHLVFQYDDTELTSYNDFLTLRFEQPRRIIISLLFIAQTSCHTSLLMFDKVCDENHFINHLIRHHNYCFETKRWNLPNAKLKVTEIVDRHIFVFFT